MLNFKKNRMKKHTFCRFSILLSIILVFLLYPMSVWEHRNIFL